MVMDNETTKAEDLTEQRKVSSRTVKSEGQRASKKQNRAKNTHAARNKKEKGEKL